MRYFILTLFIVLCAARSFAQHEDRMAAIQAKLHSAAELDSALTNEIDISVGNISFTDLVRNIATINNVNISVKTDGNVIVNCNFNRTRIIDILYFLCREYNMTLDAVGNIISIYPFRAPAPLPPASTVSYNPDSLTVSYNLINIPLAQVTRMLTDSAGVNFVVPPQLSQKRINAYGMNLPLSKAVNAIAESNEMEIFKNAQDIWTFSVVEAPGNANPQGGALPSRRIATNQLEADSMGLITVNVNRANARDLLSSVCDQMGLNYYFVTPVDFQASLFLKEVDLDTFLKVLFLGTPYSWYEESGIYMFGEIQKNPMMATVIVPLRNRTVNRLSEIIPSSLKEGIQIDIFKDQNSLILTGDRRKLARVEQFIKSVDKTIPLIMIDVIILDAKKSNNVETGITVGSGGEPITSGGRFVSGSGMNLDLNASAINSLISGFNGMGSINLGKVNPSFYANLRFLEENGDIEVQSTPRLSALNGQEATLKSGETIFYKESRESIVSSSSPIQTSSFEWKSVDANMTLRIVPFVSENNEITLTIDLEQKEFMDRKDDETPPGSQIRSFKSEIRVQNEDMVLLGGIERNSKTKTSGGLPFIARIPVLKWFFGNSKKESVSTKLNIFIKAAVIN